MKKYLLFIAVIGFTASCSTPPAEEKTDQERKEQNDKLAADLKKIEDEKLQEFKWKYTEEKDEMTDKTVYYASVVSQNMASLDFPYEGGTSLTLYLRSKNGVLDSWVWASNGQLYDDYDNRVIAVRFDDDEPVNFSVSESTSGDSQYRFINSSNKLLKRLRTAKKVKIQVQFYNNGNFVYEFDVSDLKWEH